VERDARDISAGAIVDVGASTCAGTEVVETSCGGPQSMSSSGRRGRSPRGRPCTAKASGADGPESGGEVDRGLVERGVDVAVGAGTPDASEVGAGGRATGGVAPGRDDAEELVVVDVGLSGIPAAGSCDSGELSKPTAGQFLDLSGSAEQFNDVLRSGCNSTSGEVCATGLEDVARSVSTAAVSSATGADSQRLRLSPLPAPPLAGRRTSPGAP